MLGIGGALVFRSTFNRPNLFYEIRPKPDTSEAFLADLASLCQQRFAHQSGIIYCFSRKESEQLAGELKQRGVKVRFAMSFSFFIFYIFIFFDQNVPNAGFFFEGM